MAKLSIYLAGKIQKAHEAPGERYWSPDDLAELQNHLGNDEVLFLNPAIRTDDLSDQKSVFGRDMAQVFCSDIVLVDARDRRGLGVGAEMMWAKMNRIPVVTLAPRDTHYHHSETTLLGVQVFDWIHPFVESLSDRIAEDLKGCASAIRGILEGETIKGPEFMHEAMAHYRESQLPLDEPMAALVGASAALEQRITTLQR